MAISEIVWGGDLKGLFTNRAILLSIFPATECILVVSRASSRERGGIIAGNLLANIVLLAPGGPIIIKRKPPELISGGFALFQK